MTDSSSSVVSFSEELFDLVAPTAELHRLANGCSWSEGPVYLASEDMVLWSDIPNNRIMQWGNGVSRVHAAEVEYTNGNVVSADGAIYSCSHGRRRIEKRSVAGSVTTVVDSFEGSRLNSLNDLVVKSDGSIWFTDPPYGIASDEEGHKATSELGTNYVFRYDPVAQSLTTVTDVLEEPNGLAFSPDESTLYVSDTSAALREDGSGNHHIMQFDVVDGMALENARLFTEVTPGLPDGFRVAKTGHVFTSSATGIQIFDVEARLLGRINVPEITSNCVFGGTDGQTLFITASTSLYSIETKVTGATR